MREAAHDALAFIIIWTIVSAVTLTILAVVADRYVKPVVARQVNRAWRRVTSRKSK